MISNYCHLPTEQGSILVQYAIVLPFLVLLFTSIVDFGFLLNDYVVLTRAVHEGVMVGVRQSPADLVQCQANSVDQAIEDRVRQSINISVTTGSLSRINTSPENVSVSCAFPDPNDPAGNGSLRVSLLANYQGLFYGPPYPLRVSGSGPLL